MKVVISDQLVKNSIPLVLKHNSLTVDNPLNQKVYYDNAQHQLIWLLPVLEAFEYEDAEELAVAVSAYQAQNLSINVDEFHQSLGEWTWLVIDRLLYWLLPRYSLKSNVPAAGQLTLYTKEVGIKQQLNYLLDKANTRNFVTQLQDTPPNIMHSEYLATALKERLSNYQNLKVKILGRSELKELKMNLLLAVNQASHHEPQLMVIEYKNNPESQECLALVGKGITMDTGGYSLKAWKSQQMMKFDMSGAAVVCSAMELIARYQPKINIVAVAPITDNLIGGHGLLTDSVIQSMNGLTVEIENTDCEGRLVLADGVTYAIRECHATKIITVATLTGSAMKALGVEFTAGFTTDQSFYNQFASSCNYSWERLWQMPLTRINTKNQQHSPIADIWNEAPSSNGGSSNGAGFVQQFTEGLPFIHLDICGSSGMMARHGTGAMCTTIADYCINVLK